MDRVGQAPSRRTATRSAAFALAAAGVLVFTSVAPAAAEGGEIVGWGNDDWSVLPGSAGLSDVVQMSTSQLFGLALHSDGTVTGWGEGEFSDADLQSQSRSPVPVPSGLDDVVQVVAGGGHALFLRENGQVVSTGRTDFQQSIVPGDLGGVVQLASEGQHTLALREDGTVAAWGWNAWGQLDMPQGVTEVVQVAAGTQHSMALHRDGTVTIWGSEQHGEATAPGDLGTVVYLAAGPWHSIAILADGSVVTWGFDLPHGDGHPGLRPVIQVDAGLHNYAALHADGHISMWGVNDSGLLDIPSDLGPFTQLAIGRFHGFALADPDAATLSIEGAPAPGSTVTAQLTNWRGSSGDVTYQWYVGGEEVSGAQGAEYVIDDDAAGSRILVRALSDVPGSSLLISEALEVLPEIPADQQAGGTSGGAEGDGGVPWPLIVAGIVGAVAAAVIVFVFVRRRAG